MLGKSWGKRKRRQEPHLSRGVKGWGDIPRNGGKEGQEDVTWTAEDENQTGRSHEWIHVRETQPVEEG